MLLRPYRIRSYGRSSKRLLDFMEEHPILAGIPMLLVGICLGIYYFGYVYPTKSAVFGPEGQETPGTIQAMYESPSRNNITYYAVVAYQDANGRPYLVRDTYNFTKWFALKDDRNATVRFLKQDPRVAFEMHSQQAEKPSLIWYGLQCGVCLFLGIMLIFYGFSLAREEKEAQYVPAPSQTSNRRPPPPGRPLA